MRYETTEVCPEQALIQHLESGDYDYSKFESAEQAWEEHESEQRWVDERVDEFGTEALDQCRQEFVRTLEEYNRVEILDAAAAGCDWPIELGFVVEVQE